MVQFIRKRFLFIATDLLVVALSYFLTGWIKSGVLFNYFDQRYTTPFLIFLALWPVVSLAAGKYSFEKYDRYSKVIGSILSSNFIILGTASLLIYFFNTFYFSRFLVLGTLLLATVFELVLGIGYHHIKVAKDLEGPVDHEFIALQKHKQQSDQGVEPRGAEVRSLPEPLAEMITRQAGHAATAFIARHNIHSLAEILLLVTTNPFNILSQIRGHKYIINLRRVNDIRFINKFFETVNENLPMNGRYTCCVETKDLRKKRLFRKFPFPLNYFYYYFIDFPVKRVMPKLKITRGLYFRITRGNNRVITRAETLGRLISCGFEIIDEEYIGDLCYITSEKVKAPAYDPHPTYGPLIRLNRVGKDGKMIKVYKMRTMHPFSEYLQEYIYKRYDLDEGGKFRDDFRVTTQGRIMRKLWIDELPMLINWLKGDMKLVGVRPISKQYFSLYSKEHQQLRLRHKPGLIPPYYADMPKTLEEIEASERKYLLAWEKAPFRTDWQYFWRALYNIVFKKARSK